MTIDARNGCWGNEEASADDEFSFSGADALKASVDSAGSSCGRQPVNGTAHETLRSTPIRAKGHSGNIAPAAGTNLAPKYDGNLLPAMTAMVTGFVDKLAKFYSPCPQGKDCAGDGKHNRLFACDQCSFVGCSDCMDSHEAEAHWSDSDTAREMHS